MFGQWNSDQTMAAAVGSADAAPMWNPKRKRVVFVGNRMIRSYR